jgi:endonuclease/exonuclease/phosphatase (EEP) superfamily protein YafD
VLFLGWVINNNKVSEMQLKKMFVFTAALPTGLLLIINAFSFLGEYDYLCELLTHFRLQYLVLFLVSSLFFIILFNKKWLFLSLFGLLLNAVPVLSLYLPSEGHVAGKNSEVSLLLANVLSSNQLYTALLNEIKRKKADIIVVLELTPQWAKKLKAIDENYPHQKLIPRTDNFGIGLYSKYPLENINTVDFASNDIPSITASILINKKQLNIIATHPFPPMNSPRAEQQKMHLENLVNFTKSKKGISVLIAGDLNSTPWSPRYKRFMSDAGLKNTRQGKGVYPTWPAGGTAGDLLRIPLDHVLVTDDIYTQKFEKLDSINSDHFPIYVELKF